MGHLVEARSIYAQVMHDSEARQKQMKRLSHITQQKTRAEKVQIIKQHLSNQARKKRSLPTGSQVVKQRKPSSQDAVSFGSGDNLSSFKEKLS